MSPRKTWMKALGLALLALCAAAPSRAAQPDPLVPGDAEMVVAVNVRQMLDSPLVKKYSLGQMKAALKANEQAQKMLAATGVDPFKDVDRVVLAKGAGGNDKVLVVVRGRFDPEKVQAAAADFAEKEPGKLKISKQGGVRLYELKTENKPAFAAFAGKNALVVSPTRESTLEAVKNAGNEAPELNQEMQAALGKVTGKESVWWAVVITEEMKKQMKKNPQAAEMAPNLDAITGSFNLAEDARISLQVHTRNAKAAGQVKMLINQVKPLLAVVAQSNEELGPVVNELMENLKVTSQQNTVRVDLQITEEMIEKAAKKENGKGKEREKEDR